MSDLRVLFSLDLGFTVAVVEALAFGGQDMFDGLTRQTDCLALLKVLGVYLVAIYSTILGPQLWGHTDPQRLHGGFGSTSRHI